MSEVLLVRTENCLERSAAKALIGSFLFLNLVNGEIAGGAADDSTSREAGLLSFDLQSDGPPRLNVKKAFFDGMNGAERNGEVIVSSVISLDLENPKLCWVRVGNLATGESTSIHYNEDRPRDWNC